MQPSTTVSNVVVTADDSIPIQSAINSLGTGGGTVCVPPGTYMIGTTGAITNQPIVLGSNIRLIGAGKGATVLQLCQEANILYQSQKPTPVLRMAGPMFVNASNLWWLGTTPSAEQDAEPYYGLPYDSNIEIAGITFDGNKNHQTLVYESEYRPNPTTMPAPTTSVLLAGALVAPSALQPQGGTLAAGTYDVFLRFQDAAGNEGIGVGPLGTLAIAAPNNALTVSLPPVFPAGAVWVVPYVRRADPSSSAGPINENDSNGNPRYERLTPIQLNATSPNVITNTKWGGNPNPNNWPTITILSHTLGPGLALYPNGGKLDTKPDTQCNYRFPGLMQWSGDTGASYFGYFINANKIYVHDIEICNFVSDGLGLESIYYSQFERIHSRGNGRHGLSIVTDQMEEVDFKECVFELNASWGADLEGIGCSGLRFSRCSFLNNGHGLGIKPEGLVCRDLELDTCVFDGNDSHLLCVGSPLLNLKVKDCRFRNNISSCVQIFGANGVVTGEISGCDFDQANGTGAVAIAPYTGSHNELRQDTTYTLWMFRQSNWLVRRLYSALRTIISNHGSLFRPDKMECAGPLLRVST